MPTYLNETDKVFLLEDLQGKLVGLNPGKTLESYKIYSYVGLTRTLDTPYYNPLLYIHEVAAGAPGDITVTLENPETCKTLRIQKIAGAAVDVYINDKANTPPVLNSWQMEDPAVDLAANGCIEQLIITFSAAGACQVLEIS